MSQTHPQPESAQDIEHREAPISVLDVVRAILFPEDETTSLPAAVAIVSESLEEDSLETAQPEEIADLSGPTTIIYEGIHTQLLNLSSLRKMILASGVLTSLALVLTAQFSVGGSMPGGLAGGLILLGLLAWGLLLAFDFAPPDGGLLKRGPQIIGPAGAAPVAEWMSTPAKVYQGLLLITGATMLSVVTYAFTGNNTFTTIGVIAWIISVILWLLIAAEQTPLEVLKGIAAKLFNAKFNPNRWWWISAGLMVVILGIAVFFRTYQLDRIPGEMTSDHVEKLLDAYDVSNGQFHIFFPRNGGREAIQMYLVALASKVFDTGMSHTTLKLVSMLEGLLLIPFIVLLGRELVDSETGWFAAILLATSWWDTTLSRLGLRIILTPLLFTMVLLCLIRGIRTGSRRSWVWAGLWMGIGVYAYQAMRMVPVVAVAAWLVAIWPSAVRLVQHYRKSSDGGTKSLTSDQNIVVRQSGNLVACGVIALAVFVPMLRFWHDDPANLWNRVINRTTENEVDIQGSPGAILANNYFKALGMFNFQGDGAWIVSDPGAPALDEISGMLLLLGMLAWLLRLRLRRDKGDILILLAALIMLLPSALAIAFPIENPSLTRASGVLPIVIVLCAWPLALVRQRWTEGFGRLRGIAAAATVIVLLLSWATYRNFVTYFTDFKASYELSALNPGEVASEVRKVIGTDGSLDGVWLVGWPFWHDYRAIGIDAGDITFSNAILDFPTLQSYLEGFPDRFAIRPLVFIISTQDTQTLEFLRSEYPTGEDLNFPGRSEKHSFHLFVVR